MKKFNVFYTILFSMVLAIFPFYQVGRSVLAHQNYTKNLRYTDVRVLEYWDVFFITLIVGVLIYCGFLFMWAIYRHGRTFAVKIAASGLKSFNSFAKDVKSEADSFAKDVKSEIDRGKP